MPYKLPVMPRTAYNGPHGGATGLGVLIFGVEYDLGDGSQENMRAGDQAQLLVVADDEQLPAVAEIIAEVLNRPANQRINGRNGYIEEDPVFSRFWLERGLEEDITEALERAGYRSVWKKAMTWTKSTSY